MNSDNELQVIKDLLSRIKLGNETDFTLRTPKVPLAIPSFGRDEIIEALDSLISSQVSMGRKVQQFEAAFANYIGTKYSVMVNSGSSANLLALSVLSNPQLDNSIKPGDEIIVPAVCWSTTISPIVQIGAVPVVVDIELNSFNIDPTKIEQAISPKTKAIMIVHLLGRPCKMDRIIEIARSNGLFLLEDSCEAHGAEFDGKKVGSFGDISMFSFYVSHHITTIEGGMVCTNSESYFELAKMLRAHGWVRESRDKESLSMNYPDIDNRFLFANLGYNFRPTEIQGAFGIHQLPKLEGFIKLRDDNAKYWNERLTQYSDFFVLPHEDPHTRMAWFAYPVTLAPHAPFERKELTENLEENGIETRPVMSGNITSHPMFKFIHHKVQGYLRNADSLSRQSFLIGNHQGIGEIERKYVSNCIDNFVSRYKSDENKLPI